MATVQNNYDVGDISEKDNIKKAYSDLWFIYSRLAVLLFGFLWLILVALSIVAVALMGIALMQKIIMGILTFLAVGLSGFAYYLSLVYIWYIKSLSDPDIVDSLSYIEALPLYSPDYLHLRSIAYSNCKINLAVSLLFSIALFCGAMLIPTSEIPFWELNYLSIFFTVVLIVEVFTFCADYVSTKIFLKKLSEAWIAKSEKQILKNLNKNGEIIATTINDSNLHGTSNLLKSLHNLNIAPYSRKSDYSSLLIGITGLLIDAIALISTMPTI